MFSFGHCPNYLSRLPTWPTYLTCLHDLSTWPTTTIQAGPKLMLTHECPVPPSPLFLAAEISFWNFYMLISFQLALLMFRSWDLERKRMQNIRWYIISIYLVRYMNIFHSIYFFSSCRIYAERARYKKMTIFRCAYHRDWLTHQNWISAISDFFISHV